MSGHSRWSQIKRKKGKADVQRGKLFSKILREITVAAKGGGGDPKGNMRLKAAIESAKEVNMPQDNIKRAIQKGTGELPGESYEEITYEGYGPGGVAVMVDSMTDNRNRTVAEIRHIFGKNGGNLATTGAVNWIFERKGYIVVPKSAKPEDELFEIVTDAGAEDLRDDVDNFEVITAPDDFDAVLSAVKGAGVEPHVAEVEMVPKEYKKLEGAEAKQMLKLVEALEDNDDVQKVFANFDISEADMASA